MPGFVRVADRLSLGAARANLIQATMATATSGQGENSKCTAKLTMMRATMAMTARAMIQGMVTGLRSS